MAGARAKQRLEFWGFRVVEAILMALPLELASGLMAALWRWAAPRLKRHRRALAHLALAYPQLSLAERDRIARAMWGHLGRTFAEFFHLDEIAAQGRVTLESEEQLRRVQTGGPYVVCAMHLGNWELMARVSAKEARALAGVYQPLKNPLVDAEILKLRDPLYPLGLFPRSSATLRKLMKIAKDGGSLGFMADLREGKGVAVPFFGRPAHSNVAPALIARQFGLKLYAARIMRKPGVRFSIRVEPIEVPVTDDREADIVLATARLQAKFEDYVREAPEQWMWAHRRWD